MRIIFILFFILPAIAFGQNTTQEEYNYMTKGYKVQVESGLDMKKGYTIGSRKVFGYNTYRFEFMYLYRSNNQLAGIIVQAYSGVSGYTYWYGIPIPAMLADQAEETLYKSLHSDFYIKMSALDESMTTAFLAALADFTANNFITTKPKPTGK